MACSFQGCARPARCEPEAQAFPFSFQSLTTGPTVLFPPHARGGRPALTHLFLFGTLDLRDGEGAEARSPSLQPKRGALLAYLAVARPGPWHRRDTLLSIFWPELDDERGRNALSKALHYLRQSTGGDLVLTRGVEEVRLSAEGVWCDVAAFEDAVRRGALEEAAQLYRGDLLEGFHLPGVADFSHWLDGERSRLRRSAVETVWKLADQAESGGDIDEATKWGRLGMRWSPVDEAGLRRLIELLHAQGNRTEAISTYESYRRLWREEYDLEPSEPTEALVEALRDGSLRLPERTPAIPRPMASTPDPQRPAVVPAVPTANRRSRGRAAVLALPALLLLTTAIVVDGVIGPPAGTSLSEVMAGGGRVVLADFDDSSAEGLGHVVTEALRVDLFEAPSVELVEAADIASARTRMGLEPGARLTAAVAREIALREGIPAVLDGEVSSAGTGYVLTATLRSSDAGRTLASFRAVAEGPSDLIRAIDRLSRDIREESGEPLRAVRAAPSLEQVTTTSLEALTLYTEAVRVFDQGADRRRSARLLERAVALDSTFAMAWRMLGVALQDGVDPIRREEAIGAAFRHRERLGDLERHMVEAMYYGAVARDRARAVQAYEDALRVEPDDPRALNNLGFAYLLSGDLEKAEAVFRRVIAGRRPSSGAFYNLVTILVSSGRGDEADAVLRDWARAYPEHGGPSNRRFLVAFVQGDLTAAAGHARRQADDSGRPPRDRAQAYTQLGRIAYWTGRLDEGRSLFLRSSAVAAQDGDAARWSRALDAAYEEVLVGDAAAAAAAVHGGLTDGTAAGLTTGETRFAMAALILLLAGDAEGSELLIGRWREAVTADAAGSVDSSVIAAVMLAVRALRGETEGLTDAFERSMAEARCGGDPCRLVLKAWFHDRVGDRARAVERYERIRDGGYVGWGTNTGERMWAMMRLGPLYEQIGDTAQALEAYRHMTDQWAGADARGQERVRRMRERIAALEAAHPSGGPPTGTLRGPRPDHVGPVEVHRRPDERPVRR